MRTASRPAFAAWGPRRRKLQSDVELRPKNSQEGVEKALKGGVGGQVADGDVIHIFCGYPERRTAGAETLMEEKKVIAGVPEL